MAHRHGPRIPLPERVGSLAGSVLRVSVLSIRAPRAWLGPERIVEDARVVCTDGSISAAGPSAEVTVDADEELRIDGFLIPAVADRHVHVELCDPASILRGGVTAVRDLAWPPERIFPLADLSEVPSFDGPLIRACGPMLTAPGGYPTRAAWAPEGTGRELAGVEDAMRAVRDLCDAGAVAVKVSLNAEEGPTPTDAELLAIVETARDRAIPVTVHAQGAGQVERALGAGVDELAHAPWIPLSDDAIRAAAGALRIVSTLDIHGHGTDTPQLDAALDNLRRFAAAGGTVVYGTDLGNGSIPPGIHVRECALLLEAGLSVDQLLGAATRAPLTDGAPADLVVLAADPFETVGAFDAPRLVVRAGRVVVRP
jgi:imidazolonepropionase-like amidohydrolase